MPPNPLDKLMLCMSWLCHTVQLLSVLSFVDPPLWSLRQLTNINIYIRKLHFKNPGYVPAGDMYRTVLHETMDFFLHFPFRTFIKRSSPLAVKISRYNCLKAEGLPSVAPFSVAVAFGTSKTTVHSSQKQHGQMDFECVGVEYLPLGMYVSYNRCNLTLCMCVSVIFAVIRH